MQLEDYFDFLAPDDIRLKGHRIGIECVLYEYIHRAQTPEEISQRFDTLSLEEVHATILYYLRNKEAVNRYMADWLDSCRSTREDQRRQHPAFIERMQRLKDESHSRPEPALP